MYIYIYMYIYSGTCQIEHLRTLNNFSCPGTLPLKITGRRPGYIEHLSTLNFEHQRTCSGLLYKLPNLYQVSLI